MHKFCLGQQVQHSPPRGIYGSPGAYVVTTRLVERKGQFEYRIRHTNERHERIARESWPLGEGEYFRERNWLELDGVYPGTH